MQTANNSLTAKKTTEVSISAFLKQDAIKNYINSVIGSERGMRFITSVVSMVNSNPTLAECTNQSIVTACLEGESLNLSNNRNLGQWYPVPYENKKKGCKEAQFQMGYKGYIQLALRTGQYEDIEVMEIREGEYKGRNKLTGKPQFEFIEDDAVREEKPIVGYMTYFKLVNGFFKILYWSKEKMLKHADTYSQAFSLNAKGGKYPKVSYEDYLAKKYNPKDEWLYSSYWYKNFDAMAFKTMLRQIISKWGIMSEEMQNAFEKDMSVINEDGSVEYVDNDFDFVESEVVEPDKIENQPEQAEEKKAPESTGNPAMDALFGGVK